MDQKQKQHLLKTIREIKSPGEEVFLVGGAVRDQILGIPIHDLDFAVKNDPELLAKKLANNLRAGFYVLDDLRHTARIVIKADSGPTTTLDFAKFRGSSLLEDLKSRDFTVNAMAIDLDHLTEVVDPLDGKKSLKEHQLRLCSPAAFADDPIRVLRAIRFSIKFHLAIDPALNKS
jgi:poly(A) polymerase